MHTGQTQSENRPTYNKEDGELGLIPPRPVKPKSILLRAWYPVDPAMRTVGVADSAEGKDTRVSGDWLSADHAGR